MQHQRQAVEIKMSSITYKHKRSKNDHMRKCPKNILVPCKLKKVKWKWENASRFKNRQSKGRWDNRQDCGDRNQMKWALQSAQLGAGCWCALSTQHPVWLTVLKSHPDTWGLGLTCGWTGSWQSPAFLNGTSNMSPLRLTWAASEKKQKKKPTRVGISAHLHPQKPSFTYSINNGDNCQAYILRQTKDGSIQCVYGWGEGGL